MIVLGQARHCRKTLPTFEMPLITSRHANDRHTNPTVGALVLSTLSKFCLERCNKLVVRGMFHKSTNNDATNDNMKRKRP